MKHMIRLGLTLAAYSVAACILLAFTDMLTKPVINARAQKAMESSLREVFPSAADFSSLQASGEGITNVFAALDSENKQIGTVVVVEGKTYEYAKIAAGFMNDKDQTITGVKFLELKDSPGFGQRAGDPSEKVKSGKTFYGQFAGKKAADGFILNETYDAVSGATITSTSVGRLLTNAARCAKSNSK